MAGRPDGGRSRKRRRLSRSAEFERVYRQGRSKSNRYLVLYAFPRTDQAADGPRLGLSVSRRVGGAVDRTRVKRVLREAFWAEAERLPEGSDYVVVARPDARALAEREGMPGVRTALAELVDGLGAAGSEPSRSGERPGVDAGPGGNVARGGDAGQAGDAGCSADAAPPAGAARADTSRGARAPHTSVENRSS